MFSFDYIKVITVEEALDLVAETEKTYKLMAGGTDVVVRMKYNQIKPDLIIDISKIKGLDYIDESNDYIEIGALVTHEMASQSEVIKEYGYCLMEACSMVGSPQVRSMGTIAGNIINASPAADSAIALIAVNAEIQLRSKSKYEWKPLEKFFSGPGLTVIEKDQIATAIRFRKISGRGSSFYKLGKRKALSVSIVNGAASMKLGDEGLIDKLTLAFGSVAATPLIIANVESFLVGKKITDKILNEIEIMVEDEIDPITDIRSTRKYRSLSVSYILKKLLMLAYERAK